MNQELRKLLIECIRLHQQLGEKIEEIFTLLAENEK